VLRLTEQHKYAFKLTENVLYQNEKRNINLYIFSTNSSVKEKK